MSASWNSCWASTCARWRARGISAMSRIFQNQPISSPGFCSTRRVDHLAVADRLDRFVQIGAFALVGGDRRLVALQRLAVGAELGVGVGDRDVRFQHRGLAEFALGELLPRHERELRIAEPVGGPAEAEQRLARLQALETDALEVHARVLGSALGERREAERDVGAVAQAPVFLGRRRILAELVEQLAAALGLARPEQGDAEVVANVARAGSLQRQAAQRTRGAGVVASAASAAGRAAGRALPRAAAASFLSILASDSSASGR